jgi:hypothetical protein
MSKINLILYYQPSSLEVFVRFKKTDGDFQLETGFIDTGATVSLFPLNLLENLEHKIISENFEIEQAGIASQAFKAVEAEITLYLEDSSGIESSEIRVRAWFADTDKIIIGFQDILDRAILFADFLQSRTAWLEI